MKTRIVLAEALGTFVLAEGDAITQLWAFIVFPLVGGAVGALAYKALVPEH